MEIKNRIILQLPTNLPVYLRLLVKLFRIKLWEEYTVFKVKRYNEEKKIWTEDYDFYMGNMLDWEHRFGKNDWRFCEVKDKRELAVLLGKGWLRFPIKFPVKLDNGVVLNKL